MPRISGHCYLRIIQDVKKPRSNEQGLFQNINLILTQLLFDHFLDVLAFFCDNFYEVNAFGFV